MKGFSFRSLTFMLIVAFLVWFSNIETCNARRGKHWRGSRSIIASLSKKKGKDNHNSHHHQGKSGSNNKPKQKSPPSSKSPPTSSPPQSGGKQGKVISPPIGDSDPISSINYNVLDFGAKGDGLSDDTKAFEAAWASACEVEASTLMVPAEYTFLVGPVSFSGPNCKRNIVFQVTNFQYYLLHFILQMLFHCLISLIKLL
ncbi:hypothetical protein Leryth_008043 [Lithospermum erythrorhizon]|nr:hypothetical protein Leryth_008043 [Lithospermum erythrorhizon]